MYERIWCLEQIDEMTSKNGDIVLHVVDLSIIESSGFLSIRIYPSAFNRRCDLTYYMDVDQNQDLYLIRPEHV